MPGIPEFTRLRGRDFTLTAMEASVCVSGRLQTVPHRVTRNQFCPPPPSREASCQQARQLKARAPPVKVPDMPRWNQRGKLG